MLTKYPLIVSTDRLTHFSISQYSIHFSISQYRRQQEGQVALNRPPEFCLKLTYRYLLNAGHVPGDTWGRANFGPRGII